MNRKRMFAVEGPNGCMSVDIKDTEVGRDVKVLQRQENVVSVPGPEKHMHQPTTPEEELQRTEKIFENFKFPRELTVGSLCIAEEEKRKRRVQDGKRLVRNIEEGLSVGDLTGKENDQRGLDELYQGRRACDIRPSTSESQEIDAERIRKHKEEVALQMRIRALVEGDKDEALEEYAQKYLKPKNP